MSLYFTAEYKSLIYKLRNLNLFEDLRQFNFKFSNPKLSPQVPTKERELMAVSQFFLVQNDKSFFLYNELLFLWRSLICIQIRFIYQFSACFLPIRSPLTSQILHGEKFRSDLFNFFLILIAFFEVQISKKIYHSYFLE